MDPRLELFINLIILAGMLATLCGLIVPVFPGLIVIWLLALLYGIVAGFGVLGMVLFVLITALAIVGEISDNLLMSKKARWLGLGICVALWCGVDDDRAVGNLGLDMSPQSV
jgi:uncharacterized protein YqgC (DUF456 family)